MVLSMRLRNRNRLILIIITALLSIAAYLLYLNYQKSLNNPNFWTGWTLLGLMLVLGSYNVFKKFPQIPLGRSATWLQIHIYLGSFTILIFLLHTDFSWPNGWMDSILGYCFILQSLLGITGLILSRHIPPTLTVHGENVIYERIPEHISKLRNKAEQTVLDSIGDTDSSSVSDFYSTHIAHYLNKPDNKLAHILGSKRPLHKFLSEANTLYRYLDDSEKQHMDDIIDIIHAEDNLDFQHARQGLLKHWLFIHIPLTTILVVLALTHMVIIYAFSGGGT